jgi:hypothetical protein
LAGVLVWHGATEKWLLDAYHEEHGRQLLLAVLQRRIAAQVQHEIQRAVLLGLRFNRGFNTGSFRFQWNSVGVQYVLKNMVKYLLQHQHPLHVRARHCERATCTACTLSYGHRECELSLRGNNHHWCEPLKANTARMCLGASPSPSELS